MSDRAFSRDGARHRWKRPEGRAGNGRRLDLELFEATAEDLLNDRGFHKVAEVRKGAVRLYGGWRKYQ